MKPYQQVPILDCGEPLLPIPLEQFSVEHPHPYVCLSAPYGDKSPYYLRQGVLERLIEAQRLLQQAHPNWRIQIFDAYRPLAVQQFMVDYTFAQTIKAQGRTLEQLTARQRQAILEQVYQFWAVPSYDPTTPPPHSTGAAVDVTLVDAAGQVVDMGSPIDEMSPRSHPDYFVADLSLEAMANAGQPPTEKRAELSRSTFAKNRQILKQTMTTAGFQQHPNEWWHFSWGDQLWAWLSNQEHFLNQTQNQVQKPLLARYGAV